ncbi:hypothetical protein GW17_00006582 [Ensete ventricosum]|nr:hypothetical protein GW17_00006582 [Ensete ventricosum]
MMQSEIVLTVVIDTIMVSFAISRGGGVEPETGMGRAERRMTKTRAMAIGVSNPLEQVAGTQSFEIRREVSSRSAPGDMDGRNTLPERTEDSIRFVAASVLNY